MQVLNLVRQHNLKIINRIGEEIGSGSNGQCFNLLDDSSKVIKLSIIYDNLFASATSIYQQDIAPALDYIMMENIPIYATVYEHGYLGYFHNRDNEKYIIHYYVAEKLLPLSDDENKIFHTIISHENRRINKKLSINKIEEMLSGLSRGLDFNKKMVMLFCEQLQKTPVYHHDLHNRNIMKTNTGYFKAIDFDSCKLKI